MSVPRRPSDIVDMVGATADHSRQTRLRLPSLATGGSEDIRIVGAAGEPGFGPGFSNSSGTTGFQVDGLGRVHLRGTLNAPGDANNQRVFTLPENYRPAESMIFPTMRGQGTARVAVGQDGTVRFRDAASTSGALLLQGISFEAAQ